MATDKRVVLIDLTVETTKVIKAIADATAKVEQLKKQLNELQQALNDAGVRGGNSFKEAEKAIASKQRALEKTQQQVEKYKAQLADIVVQSKKQQAEEVALAKQKQKAQDELLKAQEKEKAEREKQAQAAAQQAAAQQARDEQLQQNATELQQALQQVGDTLGATFGGEGLIPDAVIEKIAQARTDIALLTDTNEKLKSGLAGLEVGTQRYNEIQEAIAGNEIQLRGLKNELTNYQKEADNLLKIQQAESNSYESLYRQYVDAERQLKLLGGTLQINKDGTIETTAEYRKAAKEVRQLKEGLLEFNKGILDGRLNVGNYTQSLTDALSATGLFGNAITQVKGAIEGTQTAISLVKDGAKLVSDGFVSAGGAISNFADGFVSFVTQAESGNETVTSTVDAIGGIKEQANETKDTLDATGKSAINSGKAFLTGGNLGANGMKILKVAIASTGIGLLVLAVGGLIAYFTKFQKGIDLVKQAFAGLTAVFDVVVGTLGKIGEALATFDFSKAGDAIAGVGSAAAQAAKDAASLERSKQKLQDKEREQLKTQFELRDAIGDLMLIAEDKTKTDQERVDAFKQAAEAEKQLIAISLANEKERLRIMDAELKQRIANGTATREELQARQELYVKTLELEDEYNDKLKEAAVAASKIQKQINNEKLANAQALAANEIKLAELAGKSTIALRKKAAKDELDAIIADKGKSDGDKLVAQSNYEVAIATIEAEAREQRKQKNEEAAAKDKQLTQAIEDAKVAIITDARTRELAAEALALDRSLAEIQGKGEKQTQLRALLTEQAATRVLEIERKYNEQTLNETNESNQRNADALIKGVEQTYAEKQAAIATALEDEKITQEQAAAQTLAIEIEKQNAILAIQKQALADRLANEQAYFDNQIALVNKQLTEGKISAETAAAQIAQINNDRATATLTTEQTLGQQVLETQKQIDTSKVELARATSQEVQATAEQAVQKQIEQQTIALQTLGNAFSAFSELLSANEKSRKKNAQVLKALAKGEILIGAYQEISGYWQGAGKDTAKTGIFGGIGATVLATVLTATAIARAIANISKVDAQKFAEGGFTYADAVTKYNPTFTPQYGGGFVARPTMWVGGDGGLKLAGEAGTEWVGANWQVKQAPEVFSALETWRRTGVRTFADGGFTTTNVTQPLVTATQSIEAAVARGFASAPAPVVSVVEINEVQNRVQTIETRSSLI